MNSNLFKKDWQSKNPEGSDAEFKAAVDAYKKNKPLIQVSFTYSVWVSFYSQHNGQKFKEMERELKRIKDVSDC